MSVELQAFKNLSAKNVLNKSLNFVSTYTGTFREPFDLIAPVLEIQVSTLPNFNYVRIPSLKRAYFVNYITNAANGLWELELLVDVLESYSSSISSLTAVVERNEFVSDPLIIDTFQVYKQGYEVHYQYGTVDIGGGSLLDDYSDRFIVNAPLFELEPVGSGVSE